MSKSIRRGSSCSRRPGPSGPRTPAGKRRSAQNASKHKIFAGRILPDETKLASKLFAQFQADLQPQSSLELEFIGEIVQNRLQARRIDKYFVHEVMKAQVPFLLEDLERFDARYRSELICPANPMAAPGDAARGRMHPAHCLGFLHALKDMVEKYGARPDSDLVVLDRIYGSELTATATAIVQSYKMLRIAQAEGESAERTNQCAALLASILEELDREIESQGHRLGLEGARDLYEVGTDRATFLDESILSRIDRNRAANLRQFMLDLEAIKRIRGLRKPPVDAPSD